MIIDHIDNAPLYYGISEELKTALSFFREHSEKTDPVRLTETVTVKILPSETVADSKRKWEAHDHLIDIHYVAEGCEDIIWAERDKLTYLYKEEGKDVHRYEGEGTRFTLLPGMFAVMFPQDAHKTKLFHDKETMILKGIGKISI